LLLDSSPVLLKGKCMGWRPKKPAKGNRVKKIFVGNFSFSTTEADLRQLFEPYGAIESVTVVTDRDTGRSRGFGFVEMPNDNEAEAAITALNGNADGGRPLTVNEARPKADRPGGGGGRRFGGGGGGRSSGGGGGSRDDYRGHARQPREPRW
jgi:RNA recognition motif-containing protein